MNALRTIETKALYVHELEPDIHFVEMKNKAITRSEFQDMFEAHLSLSGEEKVYVIADHHKVKYINREALMYARAHGSQICFSLILVNKNKVARVLSDFFIRVLKPPFATYVVKDLQTALIRVQEIKKDQRLID